MVVAQVVVYCIGGVRLYTIMPALNIKLNYLIVASVTSDNYAVVSVCLYLTFNMP